MVEGARRGRKLGASTFIWVSPFSGATLDLIGKVRDLGFDLIEICVEDPDTIDTDAIARRLETAGLGVTVCGAFGPDRDMSAEDEAVRANARQYLARCVEIAGALGAPLVSGPMHSCVGNARLLDRVARAAQRGRAVDSLSRVVGQAEARGVRLAMEPINRFETDLVNTTEQALEMCRAVGSDSLGLLLDTFHMNIEEKDIPRALRQAGARVFEFHACASDRGTPGDDHLPWNEIRTALDEIGFSGPVVIEAFNPNIRSIARAVALWRDLAESEDRLAIDGLAHLRRVFG